MALPASPVVGAGAACLWGGCGNGHQLRSVLIDGEPWFVAADACRCLGLRNVTMATGTLTDDEKGFKTFDTLGGSQKMRVTSRQLPNLFFGSPSPAPHTHRFSVGVVRPPLPLSPAPVCSS
jgi:prophage antirepressor-like protein